MIKIEKEAVWGIDHAMRGMRNSYNSWEKSDSINGTIGINDAKLAKRLISEGSSHRKFLRQIFVSADITGPLYWWKEYDTYKVGTTANSCSTMHTLTNTPINANMFSDEYLAGKADECFGTIINMLNDLREKYIKTNDKAYWYQMIQLLPESFMQKRTVTLSYENLYNIIDQRTGHKLDEWRTFINWAKKLPHYHMFNYEKA